MAYYTDQLVTSDKVIWFIQVRQSTHSWGCQQFFSNESQIPLVHCGFAYELLATEWYSFEPATRSAPSANDQCFNIPSNRPFQSDNSQEMHQTSVLVLPAVSAGRLQKRDACILL